MHWKRLFTRTNQGLPSPWHTAWTDSKAGSAAALVATNTSAFTSAHPTLPTSHAMEMDEIDGIDAYQARLARYYQAGRMPINVHGAECITLYATVQTTPHKQLADNKDKTVPRVPSSAGDVKSPMPKYSLSAHSSDTSSTLSRGSH